MERCQFSTGDGHDAVLLDQVYFNKLLEVQYNSTVGKIIGYTKTTEEYAKELNKDRVFMNHQIWKTNLCRKNAPLAYKGLLTSGNSHSGQQKRNLSHGYFFPGWI